MQLEPYRLVFIDETGTNTKMTRLYGRSPKGRRLRAKAPFGHWKTQTFIAGLRCYGMTAPWVIDQPMNRRIFDTYIETQLAPTLSKGDIVILDNLSAHKSPKAEAAIKARGAWMLFLPHPIARPEPHRNGLFQAQGTSQSARYSDYWRSIRSTRVNASSL